eukprot:CAMPEP_0172205520 /NCGR_PEP_ID=MMETSP1050-20130122/32665_1 /TAXON_ID=233186 /ORGANISM="Cryptomonas curvata, Strain CCAP979/52" /LENGTH=934 /DNA_ID=CAMNT_0012884415 /DNA_START=185 /DNA_END=2989 /DNA_ORIENTATION=-
MPSSKSCLLKEWNGLSIIYMIGNSVGPEYGGILASNLSQLHFLLFGVSATFICTSLLLLYFHVKHFEQYKRWSDQIESFGRPNADSRAGDISLSFSWMRHRSKKEEKEVFLRLWERFVDPREALIGEVPIPADFNLGEYFILVSSRAFADVLEISASSWMILIILGVLGWAVYYAGGVGGYFGDAWGYYIFWIYDGMTFLFAASLDFYLHRVMTNLIPVDLENSKSTHQAASPEDMILAVDDLKAGVRSVVAEPAGTVRHIVESPMDSLPVQEEAQPFVDEFDRGCLSVVPESVDDDVNKQDEMVSSARSEDITPGTTENFLAQKAAIENLRAKYLADQRMLEQSEEILKNQQVYGQDMLDQKTAALRDLKSRLEAHQRSLDEAEAVLELRRLRADKSEIRSGAEIENQGTGGAWILRVPVREHMSYNPEKAHPRQSSTTREADSVSWNQQSLPGMIGDPDESNVSMDNLRTIGVSSHKIVPLDDSAKPVIINCEKEASSHGYISQENLGPSLQRTLRAPDDLGDNTGSPSHRIHSNHARFLPRYLQRTKPKRGRIRRYLGGRVVNKHQGLFWLEVHGPEAALYAIRFGLLSVVVLSAVALEEFRGRILCTGVSYNSNSSSLADHGDNHSATTDSSTSSTDCSSRPTAAGLVVLVFAVMLSLGTVLLLGSALRRLVTATSIECMKRWDDIALVVAAASRKREHTTFCTLVGIAAAANRANAAVSTSNHLGSKGLESGKESQINGRQNPTNHHSRLASIHMPRLTASVPTAEPDPLRVQLRAVFDEIATIVDGIATMNLEGLTTALQAMGAGADQGTSQQLFQVMDVHGDGLVTFEDFEAVMLGGQESSIYDPESLACQIWRMLDPDDIDRVEPETAAAKLRESAKTIQEAANAGALLRRLDVSGVGFVTKGQFVRYVQNMLVAHSWHTVSEHDI